jgi:apolipoprotein N-acyltransferase
MAPWPRSVPTTWPRVVWPEAGAGTLVDDKAGLIARAATLAQRHDVYLLVGLGVLTRRAPYMRNQAILVDPAGQVVWTYDKARPVPGMDQLSPGAGRVPSVDTPYGKLANLICFDADFPGLARQSGVDMMLVPSNDWREFGAVHTQKAALRAIENGYSLVRQDVEGLAGRGLPRPRARRVRLLHHRSADDGRLRPHAGRAHHLRHGR